MTVLGAHRLVQRIGGGATGEVWRGASAAGSAAFKIALQPGQSPLRREVEVLSTIRHPNIVELRASGVFEGRVWFQMPLFEAGSLAHRLGGCGATLPTADSDSELAVPAGEAVDPLELDEVLKLGVGLCAALSELHQRGLVHCDLKPGNVLLDAHGTPVLADFGAIGRFAGAGGRDRADVHQIGVGTPAFMAPEQFRGQPVDARTDLYALGCVVYALLTGHPPFLGTADRSVRRAHLEERAPGLPAGTPAVLVHLVARLLEKSPSDRPGYADEVGAVLAGLLGRPAPHTSETRRPYLYRAPLCGRDVDLARLLQALRGPGLHVLRAPAGAGKTRLIEAVGRRMRREGVRVAEGCCEPRGGPLHGLTDVLALAADLARAGELTLDAAACRTLHRVVDAFEGLCEPALRVVLPPDAERDRLVDAALDVIGALATTLPLLVVVDDLQWADLATRRAVQRLGVEGATVLVSERSDRAEGLRGCTEHSLDPLDDAALRGVISGMIAVEEPPEGLVAYLCAQAAGNPFFISAFLHHAVATGLLQRRVGAWVCAVQNLQAFQALGLPGTVETLMQARLATLPASALHLARAGAVQGVRFLPARLPENAEARDLDELFLRQVLVDVGDGFSFVHGRLREALYDSLGSAHRASLHLQTAGRILEDEPDADQDIAWHLHQGGQVDQAGPHAARACESCGATGDLEGVLRMGALALEATGLSREVRAQVRGLQAVALRGQGDFRTSPCVEGLRELGIQVPDLGESWRRFLVTQVARQVVHRWIWIRRSPEPDLTAQASSLAVKLLPWFLHRNDMNGMLAAGVLAANLSDRTSVPTTGAQGYGLLGAVSATVGLKRSSRRYFERARQGVAALEAYHQIATALIEVTHLFNGGQWIEAERLASRLQVRSEALGSHDNTEILLRSRATLRWLQGRFDEAASLDERALSLAERLDHRWNLRWSQVDLAAVRHFQGRHEDALELVERAVQELEDLDELVLRVNALSVAAACHTSLGDLDGGLRAAEQVLELVGRDASANFVAYLKHDLLPEVLIAGARQDPERWTRVAVEAVAGARSQARQSAVAGPLALRHQASLARLQENPRACRRFANAALTSAQALGMAHEAARARTLLESCHVP